MGNIIIKKITPYLVVLAAAVLASLAVITLVELGKLFFFIFLKISQIVWWVPLLWTPIMTVLVVYAIRKLVPDSAGTGSPHAIIGTNASLPEGMRVRFLSIKIAIGKIFFTAGSFLAGLSLGNEGPAVQIGASIVHSVRKWTGKTITVSSLIMSGNGIGLAVCFGSALGGILYCVERMWAVFFNKNKLLSMLSITAATLIYLIFHGTDPHYAQVPTQYFSFDLLIPAIVLTVINTVVAVVWARALIYTVNSKSFFGKTKTNHPLKWAAMCGFIVALLGLATGGSVVGSSELYTTQMFTNHSDYSLWFLPAKFLASMFTAWSGVSAGMFVPMLNMGGGAGAMMATFGFIDYKAILVILGMVSFLSAVARAPLCACAIVADVTGSYFLIIPMLIIGIISCKLASKLGPDLWDTQIDMMLEKIKLENK